MHTQITTPTADQELLKDFSFDELDALANSTLIPKTQIQLQELLSKNAEATLSTEETHLLDHLLAQIDYLNILKTRAKYTIKKVPPQGAGYGKRFARKPLVSIASLYFSPLGAGNYTQIIIKKSSAQLNLNRLKKINFFWLGFPNSAIALYRSKKTRSRNNVNLK